MQIYEKYVTCRNIDSYIFDEDIFLFAGHLTLAIFSMHKSNLSGMDSDVCTLCLFMFRSCPVFGKTMPVSHRSVVHHAGSVCHAFL